ncbi:MAG TPA: PA0069 family radical SAM protein [Pyrinomonadaceae bacterium]|nr:PA0069 family radical SAM protein [Pyrinomonadaceae bacterium]
MRYVENPPNPWLTQSVEWIGEPPQIKLEVFEETDTRKIITHNDSPDVGFDYTVNCYRGCIHGCTYCFSRPTHEYLGYGAGTDFDRKIVVKVNAPKLLRQELMKSSWKGDEIVFSFTSDPYVPLESHYKLTRQCLEICAEFHQPIGIITKSALIRRDIDVLQELSRNASLAVFFTIPFTDVETARAVEPYAPLPEARFHAMQKLADAGITVGIGIAPVIPGLSSDIPELLKRAKECGAEMAFINMLRLPGSVAPYFEERLRDELPTKADRVMSRIREARDGKVNSSVFGERMRGKGEYWKAVERLFKIHSQRLGFNKKRTHQTASTSTFRRPTAQASLF